MPKLRKLLIANRGEIAIRIASAAADLGIPVVAIHSEDDSNSLHPRYAEESHAMIGSGAAAYLDKRQIIDAIKQHDCNAVHPGYGFLSEDTDFAKACEDEGIVFVGPRSDSLALFANKGAARNLAHECNVPTPNGTNSETTLDEAAEFLANLPPDTPMMIKALAGGGGRGMRIVRHADGLEDAYNLCRSEAMASFGQSGVYVEELIQNARHVEVQVLGDGAGTLVHFWDRECSLQRRRQKLIEIAPSLPLPGDARERMIEAALGMAARVDYRSLGTFEFLASDDGQFWFIETNPRIQVEHTVTEEITGHDLVQAQLRLAGGETLPDLGLDQDNIPHPNGYAIQARINMEVMTDEGEPQPSSGVLNRFELPSGPGIRVDTFGYQGHRTSTAYDPLLAKVITSSRASDFKAVVRKALRALSGVRIEGVDTNIGFLRSVLHSEAVQAGQFDTHFIETNFSELHAQSIDTDLYSDLDSPSHAAGPNGAPQSRQPIPDGAIAVHAPMQGTLVELTVEPDATVSAGQQIGVLEAMKMQMPVSSELAGRVVEVRAKSGDLLLAEDIVLVLVPRAETGAEAAPEAARHADQGRPELLELMERRDRLGDEARAEAVERRTKHGKRMIRENLAEFFDETRYCEYGSLAVAAQRSRKSIDELLRISPADGMIAAIGHVNSATFGQEKARCMALAYDYTVMAGTQGVNAHRKKDRMLALAADWRIPLMVFAEGGGGRPGDTDHNGVSGLDSMTFQRLAALNGKVPIVGVTTGRCFAGNAAMLGCCDVIIATRDANIGMAGPAMIEGGGLGAVRAEDIGPAAVQTKNGVIDVLVEDERQAIEAARTYLAYFQGTLDDWDAPDQQRLRHALPHNRVHAYDVRALINTLVDVDSTMELRPDFALPLITCLARIEGRPVGILANNTQSLGGAIDADSADKAARFMQLCNAFGLPIVALLDTPGFMVGPDAEKTGLVRHVSRMFVAGAALDVPIVTIVLRKAYGLGAMAMAGGSLHASQGTFSWPTGEFGGMGLEGAVQLAYRAELAAISDKVEREAMFRQKVDELYQVGKALNVASLLEIDDVIDPAESRQRVIDTLDAAGEEKRKPNHTHIDTW